MIEARESALRNELRAFALRHAAYPRAHLLGVPLMSRGASK